MPRQGRRRLSTLGREIDGARPRRSKNEKSGGYLHIAAQRNEKEDTNKWNTVGGWYFAKP